MNYKFYANGKCTYVGTVEASSWKRTSNYVQSSRYRRNWPCQGIFSIVEGIYG